MIKKRFAIILKKYLGWNKAERWAKKQNGKKKRNPNDCDCSQTHWG